MFSLFFFPSLLGCPFSTATSFYSSRPKLSLSLRRIENSPIIRRLLTGFSPHISLKFFLRSEEHYFPHSLFHLAALPIVTTCGKVPIQLYQEAFKLTKLGFVSRRVSALCGFLAGWLAQYSQFLSSPPSECSFPRTVKDLFRICSSLAVKTERGYFRDTPPRCFFHLLHTPLLCMAKSA